MVSARVDEYVGARKDVCVNDLFEGIYQKANQMKDRDRIYDYIVYAFLIVAGVCIIVGIVMAIIR